MSMSSTSSVTDTEEIEMEVLDFSNDFPLDIERPRYWRNCFEETYKSNPSHN